MESEKKSKEGTKKFGTVHGAQSAKDKRTGKDGPEAEAKAHLEAN